MDYDGFAAASRRNNRKRLEKHGNSEHCRSVVRIEIRWAALPGLLSAYRLHARGGAEPWGTCTHVADDRQLIVTSLFKQMPESYCVLPLQSAIEAIAGTLDTLFAFDADNDV
jgi:hypothetical protein